MRTFKKIIAAAAITAVAVGGTVFGLHSTSVSADSTSTASCKYQYANNGDFTTSATPVFNSICNVPNGVGNEPDFVRIRQNSNGNDEDNTNNPTYTIGSLSATCNTGDKFDVWNYMHNNALSQDNNNGTGSAVAHDVQTLLKASGINTTASQFSFGDTISASNAATVSDSVQLDCNGQPVNLSLVPGSVHIYYEALNNWANLSDSVINGSALTVGDPTPGSGDMWGCWTYRMVIVYQVEVSRPTPPPTPTYACTLLQVTPEDNRTVKVTNLTQSATNGATYNNVSINWGDQSNVTTTANATGITHQFSGNGPYNIVATANFTVNGKTQSVSSANCETTVSFTTPPTTTPPTTTTTSTPPAQLVNTGPGSVAAIFAGATIFSALVYRLNLGRRLNRQ